MIARLWRRENGWRRYEVVKGRRWWTVSHHFVSDTWHVHNERLTPIREYSKLWLKLVETCERHFETVEPQ